MREKGRGSRESERETEKCTEIERGRGREKDTKERRTAGACCNAIVLHRNFFFEL